MTAKRLTWSQIKLVSDELIKRQAGVCEICNKRFNSRDSAVLDHCHETGLIRGLVHRSCNTGEGKVRVKANWSHKDVSSTDYLIGLGKYLEKYKNKPRELLHPSWKTSLEKSIYKTLMRSKK